MALSQVAEIFWGLGLHPQHAIHPRNRGELPTANGQGKSTYPPCGDAFQLYLRIEEERIEKACFQAQACGPVIAVGSFCTELIKGMTVEQARQISAFTLDEGLGGLPPAKRHAILLFLDSLNQALTPHQ